jgi:hypothetical protein
MLKHLREMNLFYKEDIVRMSLLTETFYNGNVLIFDYLVQWNPNGLKALGIDEDDTTLETSICYYSREIKTIIKAGLKYLPPNELGLLFSCTNQYNQSLYTTLMCDRVRCSNEDNNDYRDAGWTAIEESFEEVEDFKLDEPDPINNLYPFMVAARDQSCRSIDLVYYLLRKDPCVLLQFNLSCDDEQQLEESTSRKRKTM